MFNKQVDSRAERWRRPPAPPSGQSCFLARSRTGRNVVARRDRVLAHQGGGLTPATTTAARRQTLGPAAGLPRAALQSAAARHRDHLRRASPHRRGPHAPIATSLFCRLEPPAPKRPAGSPVRLLNASRRFDDRAQTPRRPKPPRRTKSPSANAKFHFGRATLPPSHSFLPRSTTSLVRQEQDFPAANHPTPRATFALQQTPTHNAASLRAGLRATPGDAAARRPTTRRRPTGRSASHRVVRRKDSSVLTKPIGLVPPSQAPSLPAPIASGRGLDEVSPRRRSPTCPVARPDLDNSNLPYISGGATPRRVAADERSLAAPVVASPPQVTRRAGRRIVDRRGHSERGNHKA